MTSNSLPRISAIIPAYNSARYVGRAIESVLAQSYPVCELFVVDDGSSDDTAAVVAQYGPSVTLIRQANGGPGAARNQGAKRASGEWLGLLDADDKWLPHKLEQQIAHTQNPLVGIVQSSVEDGPNTCPDDLTFARLWQRNCIANSSVLIRKTAFDGVGGFNEDRSLIAVEDYNLWLRIVAAGWKVTTCRTSHIVYESAPGHLSSQLERATKAEFANIEAIASCLQLEPEDVLAKQLTTCDRQGRYLLYHREMRLARRLLAQAMQAKPTPVRAAWWLASCLPAPVLNRTRPRKPTMAHSSQQLAQTM